MVELARLESVYTGNRIKGSNPFSSATYPCKSIICKDFLFLRDTLRDSFSVLFYVSKFVVISCSIRIKGICIIETLG